MGLYINRQTPQITMPIDPNPPNPKERVATYVYFCSLYFVTVGVLYLWGYWSPFDINILEYLDLADIIKSTAYPIATALLLMAIGAAIGDGLVDRSPNANRNGVEARFWRLVRKHMSVVVFAYITGTVALFAFAPVWKWQALPVLLALPLFVYAKHQDMLASVIPNESPRSIVLYVIVALPFLAFGRGTLTADKVISGSEFMYTTSEIPGYVAGPSSDPASLPRVVGRAGDRMFLFDPRTASLIIFKPDAGTSIVVKAYKAPATAPAVGSNPSRSRGLPSAGRRPPLSSNIMHNMLLDEAISELRARNETVPRPMRLPSVVEVAAVEEELV